MKEIKTELFEEPHEMRISQTVSKGSEPALLHGFMVNSFWQVPLIEGTYDS